MPDVRQRGVRHCMPPDNMVHCCCCLCRAGREAAAERACVRRSSRRRRPGSTVAGAAAAAPGRRRGGKRRRRRRRRGGRPGGAGTSGHSLLAAPAGSRGGLRGACRPTSVHVGSAACETALDHKSTAQRPCKPSRFKPSQSRRPCFVWHRPWACAGRAPRQRGCCRSCVPAARGAPLPRGMQRRSRTQSWSQAASGARLKELITVLTARLRARHGDADPPIGLSWIQPAAARAEASRCCITSAEQKTIRCDMPMTGPQQSLCSGAT